MWMSPSRPLPLQAVDPDHQPGDYNQRPEWKARAQDATPRPKNRRAPCQRHAQQNIANVRSKFMIESRRLVGDELNRTRLPPIPRKNATDRNEHSQKAGEGLRARAQKPKSFAGPVVLSVSIGLRAPLGPARRRSTSFTTVRTTFYLVKVWVWT
jgi:hypothetical protein